MKIFKNFKVWWLVIFGISLIISYLFTGNIYPEKSKNYNYWVQVFGTIFSGFVIMFIPYLVSIFIKKELKGKNFMIAYSICFVIASILMIL
jgi:ABC-type transport system involved in multi-copper enzyme maturation permease subunit